MRAMVIDHEFSLCKLYRKGGGGDGILDNQDIVLIVFFTKTMHCSVSNANSIYFLYILCSNVWEPLTPTERIELHHINKHLLDFLQN